MALSKSNVHAFIIMYKKANIILDGVFQLVEPNLSLCIFLISWEQDNDALLSNRI